MRCAECGYYDFPYSQCTCPQQIADLAGSYDVHEDTKCNIPQWAEAREIQIELKTEY